MTVATTMVIIVALCVSNNNHDQWLVNKQPTNQQTNRRKTFMWLLFGLCCLMVGCAILVCCLPLFVWWLFVGSWCSMAVGCLLFAVVCLVIVLFVCLVIVCLPLFVWWLFVWWLFCSWKLFLGGVQWLLFVVFDCWLGNVFIVHWPIWWTIKTTLNSPKQQKQWTTHTNKWLMFKYFILRSTAVDCWMVFLCIVC